MTVEPDPEQAMRAAQTEEDETPRYVPFDLVKMFIDAVAAADRNDLRDGLYRAAFRFGLLLAATGLERNRAAYRDGVDCLMRGARQSGLAKPHNDSELRRYVRRAIDQGIQNIGKQ
jgi:hypothetical protein